MQPALERERLMNTDEVVMRAEGITCRYGQTIAVDRADLFVRPNERVAIIGGNGSGKTTLVRALMGFHPITGGTLTINGRRVDRHRDWAWVYRSIGWMPQRQATGTFPLLVDELLASSTEPAAAHRAAESLGVGGLGTRNLTTLSGGQLQRVFLARALGCLSGAATLLIADEPTAALDFAGQESMSVLLAETGHSMLVVTHDRRLVARCHRVYEMAAGRLQEVQ